MPARTLLPGLLLGLFGLLAIAWLALRGRDIHDSARRGSRWRQRLLVAGLTLLASVGYMPASWAGKGPAGAGAIRGNVEGSSGWKRIVAIWREAEAIASGKRGAYPFDRAGKQRVLDELTAAQGLADTLGQQGKIQPATAALIKLELQHLSRGVSRKRPTEMQAATCYRPMLHTPAEDALRRIEQRLPLLEQLAGSKRVQAAVLHKVLAAVESDLRVVGASKRSAVRRTRTSVKRIKKLLSR